MGFMHRLTLGTILLLLSWREGFTLEQSSSEDSKQLPLNANNETKSVIFEQKILRNETLEIKKPDALKKGFSKNTPKTDSSTELTPLDSKIVDNKIISQTENQIENHTKIKVDSPEKDKTLDESSTQSHETSEGKNNEGLLKFSKGKELVKDGDSRRYSGRSYVDISKYVSPDFHSKNNVYTLPSSYDYDKYASDYEYHPSTPNYENQENHEMYNFDTELTTPKTEFFDRKFKQTMENINQKLEHIGDSEEVEDDHTFEDPKSGVDLGKFIEDVNNNETDTKLDFSKHKSVIGNSSRSKTSGHGDLNIEESTKLDFTSSYNKTEVIGDDDDHDEDYDAHQDDDNVVQKEEDQEKDSTNADEAAKVHFEKQTQAPVIKVVITTTKKGLTTLTKPPPAKENNSHILSNKIETETHSVKNILATSESPLELKTKITTEAQILSKTLSTVRPVITNALSLNSTDNRTEDLNKITKTTEQTGQENQVLPVEVTAPTTERKMSITERIVNQTTSDQVANQETTTTEATTLGEHNITTVRISTLLGILESSSKAETTTKHHLASTTLEDFTNDNATTFTKYEETTISPVVTVTNVVTETTEYVEYSTKYKDNTDSFATSTVDLEEASTVATDFTTIASIALNTQEIQNQTNTEAVETTTSQTPTTSPLIIASVASSAGNESGTDKTVEMLTATNLPITTISHIATDDKNMTQTTIGSNVTVEIRMTTASVRTSKAISTSNLTSTTTSPHLENLTEVYSSEATTASPQTTTNNATVVTDSASSITANVTETTVNEDITTEAATTASRTTKMNSTETTSAYSLMSTKAFGVNNTLKFRSPATKATTEIVIVHIDNNTTTIFPNSPKGGEYYPTSGETESTESSKSTATTYIPEENTTTSASTNDGLTTTGPEGSNGTVIAIAISSVGCICLVLLAGLLYVMRKRQKRFNYGQRCTPVSLDDYSVDNVSVYNSVRRKGALRASKRSYGNPAFEDPTSVTHPLNFPALTKFANNFEDIKAEFDDIPQITTKTTELPEGCELKNRYANVIPLPETRVFLKYIDGYPTSDYINANYVTGPKDKRNYYIATQAPMQNTVDDFWRMVWEQQCKVILMLTHLFENGVEKCIDYLPPSEVLDCHRLFGDFQVTLKKREVKEKYVISSLQLKNMVSNSWREVTHFWYLGWPEKGVPQEANSLIAFLIEARSYMKTGTMDNKNETTNGNIANGNAENSPVVIHCSPGTGRTGTVIACDIAIREFELSRLVDIPRIVYRIRRDRASSVQTKEQYTFIYKVISLYATKLTGGVLDSL